MTLGDLVPWGRKDRSLALQNPEQGASGAGELSPFLRLHQEMNRLFDDVFRSFEAPSLFRGGQWPHVEVEDADDAWRVTAELPGMDEHDVDVSFFGWWAVIALLGAGPSQGMELRGIQRHC